MLFLKNWHHQFFFSNIITPNIHTSPCGSDQQISKYLLYWLFFCLLCVCECVLTVSSKIRQTHGRLNHKTVMWTRGAVFVQETGAFQGLLRHRKGTIHWDHVAIVLLAFLRRKRVNCGLFWLFFQWCPFLLPFLCHCFSAR